MNDWMLPTIEQLPKGAFLIVKDNPMTIGWAQFGIVWGKLCCTIYVRHSRYTYDLLENSSSFVISVPKIGEFKNELAACGTLSGRDINKLSHCNMTLDDKGGVSGCKYHIKANILYGYDFETESMATSVVEKYYKPHDMHKAYIAEICEIWES